MIEDSNRNQYLEALKAYREEADIDQMADLFETEQEFYFEKCSYFL